MKDTVGFRGDQFFDGANIQRCDRDRLRAGNLRAQFGEHVAQQRDEQIAIDALRKRGEARAREQLIDRRNAAKLFRLRGGKDRFGNRDAMSAMFSGFARVHQNISAQGTAAPQWKWREDNG
jgi:hypothetical protein